VLVVVVSRPVHWNKLAAALLTTDE